MKAGSHCARLRDLLADGEWHSIAEILRAHPMIVHSRVAELRDRHGLAVEHRTVGPGPFGSEYRLLGGAVSEGDTGAASRSPSLSAYLNTVGIHHVYIDHERSSA
jgi:hypothetical protein